MPFTQAGDALGTVLVIGGSGFLGSLLVGMLLEEPSVSSVHIISRNPPKNRISKVVYHAGDITNGAEISSLIADIKPAVVFHCASPKYNAPEKILHDTNVTGTDVLLKCLSASPSVKALIYTSSQFAVVPTPNTRLTEEKAIVHTKKTCNNAYSLAKANAERMVLAANGTDLRTAVLRLPCVYGRDDDGFMGSFMQTLKKGQHKTQVGKNEKVFEYLFAEKACEAHILAAQKLVSADIDAAEGKKVAGEAFFITDEHNIPFFDFARKVYAFAGHPVPENQIQVMPYWLILSFAIMGEWIYRIFTLGTKRPKLSRFDIQILNIGANWDITKAKERLGYKPVEDFDAVLKATTEHECERFKIEKGPSTSAK
ncbi:hypothetical protein ACMFMG_005734 [Clarireedia jacksonii]